MTLDPRSLEHLRKISRQLPQKLSEPDISPREKHISSHKSHPIETEESPEILFKELMKASPDGRVPSHLINRLKEIESNQLNQRKNHYSNQSPNTDIDKNETKSAQKANKRTEEDILYDCFDSFLSEDED